MNKNEINKNQGIPPEKMGILSEKGLAAAKLTEEEKHYLLYGGLEELYDIWQFKKSTIPPLEAKAVDTIMNKFYRKQSILVAIIKITLTDTAKATIHLNISE
ncbi:MAG: hypothetical protein ACMUJM_01565 [bacterium]